MNNNTRTIRSEEITIDMRVLTIMEDGRKNGEIYLAAIAPDMELTVITLDEAPDILPCFDEDDACVNIPDSTLMLCYNPAQVLELGGKHYLTGPVILILLQRCTQLLSERRCGSYFSRRAEGQKDPFHGQLHLDGYDRSHGRFSCSDVVQRDLHLPAAGHRGRCREHRAGSDRR